MTPTDANRAPEAASHLLMAERGELESLLKRNLGEWTEGLDSWMAQIRHCGGIGTKYERRVETVARYQEARNY